jgi:hypothetical protein
MDQNLANQIIIEALNVALIKGCFGLQEATNIVRAIDFFASANNTQPSKTQLPQNFNESSK